MNRVRDPIHGFIHFSNTEKKVIDSPEFQRLRNIRQLALTSYVYPGALHTRFEHSLGVMEMSSRMFDTLCKTNGIKDKIQSNLSTVGLDLIQARRVLRLASLLHDIGHLPFSHGGEDILPDGLKHEDVSVSIIEEMKVELESLYFKDITLYVAQLIKKNITIPALKLLKDLISGSIDSDRMDYLLRDSHHCGVDYGYFDYKRLIESLYVVDGISGGLDLAISHGGVHSLEALILARYYMFTQVYYHRTRRIYDIYLKNYMELWKDKVKDFGNIASYDDFTLINEMREALNDQSSSHFIDAYRICNRRHHSLIYETSEFTDGKDRRKAEGVVKQLRDNYSEDYDFVIDHGKGNIHKFFVEGRDDEGDELYVIRNNRESLLTKESHIIREMPKQFYVVRIYVDSKDISQKLDKETTIHDLSETALEMEKEVR